MKYSETTVVHIFRHILKLHYWKERFFAQLRYAEQKPLAEGVKSVTAAAIK